MLTSNSVPKKRRSAADRGISFSLTVEVPRSQENRLLAIKERVQMAKESLKLSRKSSSTQNADLLESLLLAFEEKRHGSSPQSSVSPSTPSRTSSYTLSSSMDQSTRGVLFSSPIPQRSPFPQATSTPVRTTSFAFSSLSSSPTSPETFTPRKYQLSTPSTEDDEIYMCSEGALRSLFSFFSLNLSARCYFCGNPYQPDSLVFVRQGHATSVKLFCYCGDSLLWLSSPILGGNSQKYYVNLR